MNPKLSIITINLNNLDGLMNTVESIRKQTTDDYEVVVIDGGSTDGSAEYIEENALNFGYWVSEKDSGVYNAMNKGIEVAKGDYLIFLNSGDRFSNNYVLADCFENNLSGEIVYGDVMLEYPDGRMLVKKHPEVINYYYLYYEMICHQGIFFRKDIFDKYGIYNEKYKYCSDYELLWKLLVDNNVEYTHLDVIVSRYDMCGLSNSPEAGMIIDAEKRNIRKEIIDKRLLSLLEEHHYQVVYNRNLNSQIESIKGRIIIRILHFIRRLIKRVLRI